MDSTDSSNNTVNYERQESLKLFIPKAVAIVGCGGVGTWTAYFLALSGVNELWLFDYDRVADHNLNRIPLPESEVGNLKSEAVKRLILSVRPDCRVFAMGMFSAFTAEAVELNSKVSCIVAATDTWASRKEAYRWANKHHLAYTEAAAEGEVGSATGMPGNFSTPDELKLGYGSVPVWCGPCVSAALIATSYVMHGFTMYDTTIRLGWDPETNNFGVYSTLPRREKIGV